MHFALIQRLNSARTERRTCMVVTELGSGQADLFFPDSLHDNPNLAGAIADHFVAGTSGEVAAGEKRYFLRTYVPPLRIVVIGAVHIAQALTRIADTLDYEVIIVDPRALFASAERFPTTQLIADWPGVALPTLGVDRATAYVTLTHDPKLDDDALLYVLSLDCLYVGALGSQKTHAKRVTRLLNAGLSQQEIDRIRSPVGLNIGALTPEEIAVAIVAEIVATWRANRILQRERR